MAKRKSTAAKKKAPAQRVGKSPSPELSDEEAAVKINDKTGRPIRKSAGRRSLDPDYVQNAPAETESSSDVDFEDTDEGIRSHTINKKRGRSPSPPPLEPAPVDLFTDEHDEEPSPSSAASASPPNELALTFYVPPGHRGPFVVKFDLASILNGTPNPAKPGLASSRVVSSTPKAIAADPSTTSLGRTKANASKRQKTSAKSAKGFLDFPAEIRNAVYRYAFIDQKPLRFSRPVNLCKSSSFLATCSQVHEEGREILYGENTFEFSRSPWSRGAFWEKEWEEVGWKDVRNFLTMIGPTNVGLIRTVKLTCQDTSISGARSVSVENRRFINDNHLLECLKVLGEQAYLQTLSMSLHPRKQITFQDYRFLDRLASIKVDQLSFEKSAYYSLSYQYMRASRIRNNKEQTVEEYLRSKMVRKVNLFP